MKPHSPLGIAGPTAASTVRDCRAWAVAYRGKDRIPETSLTLGPDSITLIHGPRERRLTRGTAAEGAEVLKSRPTWQRRRSLSGVQRPTIALLVLAAVALSLAPTAAAHPGDNAYSWTGCSWVWLENSGIPIVARQDANFQFPATVVRDGVVNSFRDRMVDSADEWTRSAIQPRGIRHNLRYFDGVNEARQVNLRYRSSVFGGEAYATTMIDTTGCDVHGFGRARINRVTIDVYPRTDWFTQDNSRRTYWEQQCPGGTGTPYTCGKVYDFGSTIMHEFGHVFRITHPDAVDAAHGEGCCDGPDNDRARCWNHRNHGAAAQATMCYADEPGAQSENRWRTERRTLDFYDSESLARHYAVNRG